MGTLGTIRYSELGDTEVERIVAIAKMLDPDWDTDLDDMVGRVVYVVGRVVYVNGISIGQRRQYVGSRGPERTVIAMEAQGRGTGKTLHRWVAVGADGMLDMDIMRERFQKIQEEYAGEERLFAERQRKEREWNEHNSDVARRANLTTARDILDIPREKRPRAWAWLINTRHGFGVHTKELTEDEAVAIGQAISAIIDTSGS